MTDDPAILLDITRLVSRLGGGVLTGIDRVEAEWLRHLRGRPHLLICRSRSGQMLLPPAAGENLLRWLTGDLTGLGPKIWLDRWRKGPALRAQALRALGQSAMMQTGRKAGSIALAVLDRLGSKSCYLNVGHANFDPRLWGSLASLRRVVLIHDTIPLDHPEFTRRGQSEKFRARFMVACGMADLILTVSECSADAVALWRGRLGIQSRAPIIAVPNGTRLAAPDNRNLPPDLERPFFVTLGTIEPRKNHALLLDVWQLLSQRLPEAQMPVLLIIGQRGWENHDTFARLDALPIGGPVRELAGLTDGVVAALLLRSHALLMPSFVEGFGLPMTEAAGRGVPVLATPFPAAQEVLGDYACYVASDDPIGWADKIERLTLMPQRRQEALPVMGWQDHFALARKVMQAAERAVPTSS